MLLAGKSSAEFPLEGADLYGKLVWVTFYRLLIVSVLLGATAVLAFSEHESLSGPVQHRLYALVGVVYAGSLISLGLLRWSPGAFLRPLAYVQIVGDVLLAAYLVWFTGGYESVFTFLFSLGIINAAILLYRPGAFFAASLASIAYSGLTAGLHFRVFPAATDYLTPGPLTLGRAVFTIAINAGAFFLVSTLASSLTDQLRRTGERLSEARQDYAALAELHGSIVESVTSGILTFDVGGQISSLNRAGQELLGRSRGELIGARLEAILPELWAAVRGGALVDRHEVRIPVGSEERHIGLTVSPLALPKRGSKGRVIVFQDLTAMRRMEELAYRNERLAALGELSAGLAHEIRNPLASMSGSIELLRSSLPAGADEERLMSIVLREADRLERLITDFLQFARPSPPTISPVAVAKLIEEAVAVFRNDPVAAHCALVTEVNNELVAWTDDAQLRQVILNLLLNAAQAMEHGGEIHVAGIRRDGHVWITIRDQGPGLEPDMLTRIFDPFFTTKDRGTGLGLALVHRTIEAHEGRVLVESTPGEGTRFSVVLKEVPERLELEAS